MTISLERQAELSRRVVEEIKRAGLECAPAEPQIIVRAMVTKPANFIDVSGQKANGVIVQWCLPMSMGLINDEQEKQFIDNVLLGIPFLQGTLKLIGKDVSHGEQDGTGRSPLEA